MSIYPELSYTEQKVEIQEITGLSEDQLKEKGFYRVWVHL